MRDGPSQGGVQTVHDPCDIHDEYRGDCPECAGDDYEPSPEDLQRYIDHVTGADGSFIYKEEGT